MQIDDYGEGQALTDKINANLPMRAFPTKQLIQSLREQGQSIKPNQAYEIASALYSGDMGGITCALNNDMGDEERYVVSITHLKVDPEHPLASEIEAYQRKRIRMLAIQNSRGFAAELLASRPPATQKKSKKKGFAP